MATRIDSRELLGAANELVARFVNRTPQFEMFMELNEALLRATGSEYGFVARVFRNEKGPYIKTVALSNIAWNEETRKLYTENSERGMVFDNVESLFGQVVVTGKPYISLSPSSDPNSCGIPAGHPALNTFMGIPIVRDEVLTGMVGLANGDGYCNEMVEDLRPLIEVTSQILHATGSEYHLVPDGNYFREPDSLVSTFMSGVISVDADGVVNSANRSAALLFGYERAEITGQKIEFLIPPTGNDNLYDLEGGTGFQPGTIGQPYEATATNKYQSYFPVEITVERMADDQADEFVLIIRDISEEKRRERFRSEFISMVSHELRTPLTAVHLSLSMLDSEEHRPESRQQVDDLVSMARRNCVRLVNLVDDILDFEKLNLDEIVFNYGPVEIPDIVTSVRETTTLLAEQKAIDLVFEVPELNRVVADRDRVGQVLINLIANAIRASEHGRQVTVGFEAVPSMRQVSVFVEDNGHGISEDKLDRIFEPFRQLHSDADGAGLGLSICKRIVENHESRIVCTSSPGKGARFEFLLHEHNEIAPEMQSSAGGGSRILWIENDLQHYQFCCRQMSELTAEIELARNASHARHLLNCHAFELVVIGYPVALADCVEFVREIRNMLRLLDLPIVMYSNGLSAEVAAALEAMGVECGIKKSWNLETLSQCIQRRLKTC